MLWIVSLFVVQYVSSQVDVSAPSKSYITSPSDIVFSVGIKLTVKPFGIVAVSVPSLYVLFPPVAVSPAEIVSPPPEPPPAPSP